MITRVSDEERDKLVAEVMRLMLFSQYRDGAPRARADISKLVSSHSNARGLTSWIIAQAQVRFMSIFGYEMKELSKTTARKRLRRAPDHRRRTAQGIRPGRARCRLRRGRDGSTGPRTTPNAGSA